MAQNTPYILVAVPALGASAVGGGIVRGTAYLQQAWDAQSLQPPLRRMATRGEGALLWSALLVLKFCLVLVVDSLRGRIVLVHINLSSYGSTWRKLVVMAVVRLCRRPVVLHLRGSVYDEFFRGLGGPGRALVRWLFRSADRVIVLGNDWRRFVIEEIGADASRVVVRHNAVPDPRRSDDAVPPERPGRIVFLGRIGARKGVPELLDALARPDVAAQEWQATLAGDGDIGQFRERAAALGLGDRVAFPGWLSVADSQALLRQARIFVLPSHAEGLSNALLEAMAFGRAIVATPVGGHAEVITDGKNGLLVAPGNSDALADALLRLLRQDDLAAAFGTRARAAFEAGFEMGRYARRLKDLYDDVLASRRTR